MVGSPGVNAVKPLAVKIPGGNVQGEPRWQGGDMEVDIEEGGYDPMQADYEAQAKGEERPKMVAAKTLPMVTRAKLQKGLKSRYGGKQDMAMVGVDMALGGQKGEFWGSSNSGRGQVHGKGEVRRPPIIVEEVDTVTPLRFVFARKVGPDGQVQRYKARLFFQNRGGNEEKKKWKMFMHLWWIKLS